MGFLEWTDLGKKEGEVAEARSLIGYAPPTVHFQLRSNIINQSILMLIMIL